MATEQDVSLIRKKLDKWIKNKTNDERSALDLLRTLQDSTMSLETLKKTRIGLTVNNVRKATTHEDVINLSKQLIKRWKKLLPEPQKDKADDKRRRSKDKQEDKQEEKPDGPDNADKESDTREPERLTPEDIRSKCRELLCDTLKSDECVRQLQDPLELATLIEENIFEEFKNTDYKYKNRIRSRVANLKDSKNPALKENVLRGLIPPESIAKMTAEEMASERMKELRAKFTKEAIDDYQMAKTGGANTDLFKCGRCDKRNCTYNQVQILCSDEPMTTFVLCNECGHRWKFT